MSIGKIKELDIKCGTWIVYADRLEMYFKVNKINEDTRMPTLIAVMGDEAYELLCNLASPKKPAELTYTTAVELLRLHLEPTPSVLAERYRFRQRRQAIQENIATYVAELKKLARHCMVKEGLNENLRDQFICGLRSDIIRQRLFSEADTITYMDAVRLAISLEAAERDAAAVEATTNGEKSVDEGKSGTLPIHALTSGQTDRRRQTWWVRSGTNAGTARQSPAHSTRSHAGRGRNGSSDRSHNCVGCGATEHSYSVCQFRNYVCSICRPEGHLRRVCPDWAARRITGEALTRRSRINYGALRDNVIDEEGSPEEDLHSENCTLYAGHKCGLILYAVNTHPSWGPDRYSFRPERWLDPSQLPENGFATYSIGRRSCIGKGYASLFMKTVLIHLLRNYKITADDRQLKLKFDVLLKAESGHFISIEERTATPL